MKSFEKEYRKMIQKEAPDFWNKIEAELADRESTLSVMTGDREKINKKNGWPEETYGDMQELLRHAFASLSFFINGRQHWKNAPE